jgi:multiple sugar transport system ATP-binding protein
MRAELKRLQKDLKITTIYVTHDQVEAMTMADKVAIMNHGVLQQFGSPHEVFHHPANLFVAGFIGSPPMNFIECTLTEKDELCFLDAGIFSFPITNDISKIAKAKAAGSELILGIRPEDLFLGKKKTPEMVFKAKVYVIEPLGSEIIIDLKVQDKLVKVKTKPDFKINIDEEVWIGFNKERMHLFDKKTEKCII